MLRAADDVAHDNLGAGFHIDQYVNLFLDGIEKFRGGHVHVQVSLTAVGRLYVLDVFGDIFLFKESVLVRVQGVQLDFNVVGSCPGDAHSVKTVALAFVDGE